ncbi:MAG: DUF302 domain-containing protein [Gammaproteobacteria bacterium]|nr:DUF302 domain-containing protein [Gammaproteobacteria bacterium]
MAQQAQQEMPAEEKRNATTRYKIRHLMFHALINLLAGIGALTTLILLFLYFEGIRAIAPFEPEFLDMASEVAAKTLQADVPSALVIKIQLEEGVSAEKAIESMESRAQNLNINIINRHSMHKAIKAKTGKEARMIEIFEFCHAATGYDVLSHNPDFVAFMPCRVAMYEDESGKIWLITLNLNLLIHGSKNWNREIKIKALTIQDGLLNIMAAGASGDF